MRLLIAEDEKALNNVIAKRLTAEGYSVDSTARRRSVLLKWANTTPLFST